MHRARSLSSSVELPIVKLMKERLVASNEHKLLPGDVFNMAETLPKIKNMLDPELTQEILHVMEKEVLKEG